MQSIHHNKVFSWGLGADGRLGTANQDSVKTPLHTFTNVKQAHCAGVLNLNGEIIVFGGNKKKQLISDTNEDKIVVPKKINTKIRFQSLSMGYWHFLALDEKGKVYSHGYSKHGAVGTTRGQTELMGLSREDQVMRAVYAGNDISFMVDHQGALWCCGQKIMNGQDTDSEEIHLVEGMKEKEVVDVSAGYNHVGAVTQDGGLYTWGDNSCGQLGVGKGKGTKEAQRVEGLEGVVQVSCSVGGQYSHTGCVDAQGVGYMWGSNYKYKLGHVDINLAKKDSQAIQATLLSRPKPIQFFQNEGVLLKQIISGGIHAAALDTQGHLWTFGCGSDGRLGHEDIKSARYLYKELQPVMVVFPMPGKVVQAQSSYYHMTAVVEPE